MSCWLRLSGWLRANTATPSRRPGMTPNLAIRRDSTLIRAAPRLDDHALDAQVMLPHPIYELGVVDAGSLQQAVPRYGRCG